MGIKTGHNIVVQKKNKDIDSSLFYHVINIEKIEHMFPEVLEKNKSNDMVKEYSLPASFKDWKKIFKNLKKHNTVSESDYASIKVTRYLGIFDIKGQSVDMIIELFDKDSGFNIWFSPKADTNFGHLYYNVIDKDTEQKGYSEIYKGTSDFFNAFLYDIIKSEGNIMFGVKNGN